MTAIDATPAPEVAREPGTSVQPESPPRAEPTSQSAMPSAPRAEPREPPAGVQYKPDSRPLEPGRPVALLGWLRGSGNRMWPIPIPVWLYVAVSIPLTLGLGTWGFLELPLKPTHFNIWESIFRAIKLYTFDLGPAAAGSHSPKPNWQMWVALILAALLVLRGLLGLLRTHLQRWATRYVLRRHVIVCGAGVHGTELVKNLSREHDVVLLDLDAGAPGMLAPWGKHEWR